MFSTSAVLGSSLSNFNYIHINITLLWTIWFSYYIKIGFNDSSNFSDGWILSIFSHTATVFWTWSVSQWSICSRLGYQIAVLLRGVRGFRCWSPVEEARFRVVPLKGMLGSSSLLFVLSCHQEVNTFVLFIAPRLDILLHMGPKQQVNDCRQKALRPWADIFPPLKWFVSRICLINAKHNNIT